MLPQKSLHDGRIGEIVVRNYFDKQRGIKSIVDVRDDRFFQSQDVDFLFEDTNYQFHWVEVKTDFKAHESGNFVYEVESGSTLHTIGCFEKTKAQLIAYYVPVSGHIYLLSVKKLREYVKNSDLKAIKMGDNALGFLIPIADLERYQVIIGMYEAERILKAE